MAVTEPDNGRSKQNITLFRASAGTQRKFELKMNINCMKKLLWSFIALLIHVHLFAQIVEQAGRDDDFKRESIARGRIDTEKSYPTEFAVAYRITLKK